jgi:hypothetical protein
MDFILKNLAHITNFITWLTFRKVLLLALAVFVGLTLYTVYEQRARVVALFVVETEVLPVQTTFVVSSEMQDRIRALVTKNPLIKSVNVLVADIHLNRRTVVFRFSEDEAANAAFEKMVAEKGSTQPIFTSDAANNAQMVAVINGEFVCQAYKDTINAQLLPSLAATTPTICRISLPPYYGDFSGYLAISLTRVPAEFERLELQQTIKLLATDLFFKDVVRR